ncbi:MAG TPA: hypothetical protein VG327_05150 [Mycobacterium sp.]|nr:hypothetical protein [Mycobacterium sp.]
MTDRVRDSRGTGEPYDGVAEIWIDFDVTADDPEARTRHLLGATAMYPIVTVS